LLLRCARGRLRQQRMVALVLRACRYTNMYGCHRYYPVYSAHETDDYFDSGPIAIGLGGYNFAYWKEMNMLCEPDKTSPQP
jgi:hypothetical protein